MNYKTFTIYLKNAKYYAFSVYGLFIQVTLLFKSISVTRITTSLRSTMKVAKTLSTKISLIVPLALGTYIRPTITSIIKIASSFKLSLNLKPSIGLYTTFYVIPKVLYKIPIVTINFATNIVSTLYIGRFNKLSDYDNNTLGAMDFLTLGVLDAVA